ncbi:hypothetical protein YC2023_101764 [Brassica napus]
MSNSNADEPPENYTTHPPPPPSLSSLPDEIDLSSLYVCFQEEYNDTSFHWLTLCPTEETSSTTTEYEFPLLPNPTPFPSHKYGTSTVAVGLNIFFIGRSRRASSDVWILDTRSGNMTQGPSMSLPRNVEEAAVGVIDGKIYVIGGEGYQEEIQVEVFDPKSETWELAGLENVCKIPRCSASVERKVYMVEYEKTSVYNPRECEGERLVKMVSERLSERGRKETVPDTVERVCVVEDVLFACFKRLGVLWFDTKGKLVVLYMWGECKVDDTVTKSVRCKLVSVHRAGDRICGTIDWSGVVGTVPSSFCFLHCLAVSE